LATGTVHPGAIVHHSKRTGTMSGIPKQVAAFAVAFVSAANAPADRIEIPSKSHPNGEPILETLRDDMPTREEQNESPWCLIESFVSENEHSCSRLRRSGRPPVLGRAPLGTVAIQIMAQLFVFK